MAEIPALHPTCLDSSTIGQVPGTTWVCGPGCPRPAGPDPDRDARVDAYRDRERRRAARALDRYIEALQAGDVAVSAVAGDRVVELIGDYVLARLGDTELNVQQKSHYGAREGGADLAEVRCSPGWHVGCDHDPDRAPTANCEIHGDACAGDPVRHNADSVVPDE